MPKLFSFLKGRRKIIFVLFLFIAFSLILPLHSSAQTVQSKSNFKFSDSCSTTQGQNESMRPYGESDYNFGILYNLAINLAYFFSATIFGIVGFLDYLFSAVSSSFLNKSITTGFGQEVLTAVKNLANMVIVLGFVVIGIAFALRIGEYGSKKTLIKLIIIALLINFIGLFVGLVIDASNIATTGIVQQGQSPYEGTRSIRNVISCSMNNLLRDAWYTRNAGQILATYGMGLIVWVVWIYALIISIAIFLERYIILTLLYIISPLALIALSFPATKQFWTKWLNIFLKWAFIGVGLYFTFFLAGKSLAARDIFSDMTMRMFVAICFIIIGVKVTKKGSAVGAAAAIGLAGGAVGYAMGAGKKIAKTTGKAAWHGSGAAGVVSRAGAGMKDKATAVGEKIGFIRPGTTKLNQANRLKDTRSRLETAYGDNAADNTKLAKIATQRSVTSGQQRDKAAAAEILAKRKAFGYISQDKQESAAAHATAFGVPKETFTKMDAGLLSDTTKDKAREELIKEERAKLAPQMTPKQLKKQLKKYEPSEAAIGAKHGEMQKAEKQERKLDAIPVTDREVRQRFMDDLTTKRELNGDSPAKARKFAKKYKPNTQDLADTKTKLSAEREKEKTLDFKFATREDAKKDLIDKETKRLRATGLTGKALDTDIKTYSDGLTGSNINDGLANLNTEREVKAIKKLSVSRMRELPESQIDTNIVEHSNFGTFRRASLEFTAEQKDKVQKLRSDLRGVRDAVGGLAPLPATATKAQKTAQKLNLANAVAVLPPTQRKEAEEKIKDLNKKISFIKRL